MSLEWRDFPDAPAPGRFLCRLDEIPVGGNTSLLVDAFPVLLVAVRGKVLGFVNCCPHQYLPLDHRGREILSADGERLICSNHEAVFRVSDGQGISGEGCNRRLSPIPLSIRAEKVFIADQVSPAAPT